MTVKLPWTDRRSRSLPSIERPTINLPSVDLPNMELRRIDLPRVDIRRVDLPRVDVPRVDLRNVDLRNVDLRSVDLPSIDLPKVDLPDVNLNRVGRAVSEAISDIADTLSDTLSDTGERARETVTTIAASLPADLPLVARFLPKPRSSMRPRIIAIAAASAVAAGLAGIYLLFSPGSGARRRAALRRRLQGTPAAAQRGIGVAVESARQVGDKAAELVRVPIETVRDKVTSQTDEIEPTDGTPSEILAVNAMDVAALESDGDQVDMTAVAIEAEAAEDGFSDGDAATSIYGEPHIVGDEATEGAAEETTV